MAGKTKKILLQEKHDWSWNIYDGYEEPDNTEYDYDAGEYVVVWQLPKHETMPFFGNYGPSVNHDRLKRVSDPNMTDAEYEIHCRLQAFHKHSEKFTDVVNEIKSYVSGMIEARADFFSRLDMKMNARLSSLEIKQAAQLKSLYLTEYEIHCTLQAFYKHSEKFTDVVSELESYVSGIF